MPSGFDIVLDGILEAIAKDGSYEIDWSILLNTAFRSDPSKPSPSAQLSSWARENNLRFDSKEQRQGKKKLSC
jgi:hypothetical protein